LSLVLTIISGLGSVLVIMLELSLVFPHFLSIIRKFIINIIKTNSIKKKEILEKKKLNFLKKIESFESKLGILESYHWNPMDSKYSNYLINYCINQLNIIIDELRNKRNEYSFKTAYLYDQNHKGNLIIILSILIFNKFR